MERKNNQLTKSPETHLVNSLKQGKIAFILTDINDVLSYDMDAHKIANWAKHIDRILPELDLDKLRLVIDRILTGEFPYNQNNGIQNIFNALRESGAFGKPKMVY